MIQPCSCLEGSYQLCMKCWGSYSTPYFQLWALPLKNGANNVDPIMLSLWIMNECYRITGRNEISRTLFQGFYRNAEGRFSNLCGIKPSRCMLRFANHWCRRKEKARRSPSKSVAHCLRQWGDAGDHTQFPGLGSADLLVCQHTQSSCSYWRQVSVSHTYSLKQTLIFIIFRFCVF